MAYWDNPKNVEQYIGMAAGYDGRELIAVLRQHLPDGATVLELGMGPGVDLLLLAEHYAVTGSDVSQVFVDRFRKAHPDADLLRLDAVTLDTDRRWDAIYSNKVLVHLTPAQLAESFRRQAELLAPGGLLLHAFWRGTETEEFEGLLFVQHTEESLREAIGGAYQVIACEVYAEMEPDDSLYVVLRRA